MGNAYVKFKKGGKSAQLNAILQTSEGKGFLAEISSQLPFDEAVSKLACAVQYLRQLDEFASMDVQKLLSFIRFYTLANRSISREQQIDWINQLCKEHVIGFSVQTWKLLFNKKLFSPKNEKLACNFRMIAGILWNCLEVSIDSCQAFCQADGVKIVLDSLASKFFNVEALQRDAFNANRLYLAHSSLCILCYALSHWPETKHNFRDSNGLEICKNFLFCDIDIIKVEAFLCLAFAVNEHENHVVLGGGRSKHFSYITKILADCTRKNRSRKLCPTLHLIKALNRLAASDINKNYLVNFGLLDLYTSILRTRKTKEEVSEAALGVWILAFDAKNKKKILANKPLIKSLIILTKTGLPEIAAAAEGCVWLIDNRLEREAKRFRQSLNLNGDPNRECLSSGSLRILNSAPAPAPSLSDFVSSQDDLFLSCAATGSRQVDNSAGRDQIMISYEQKFKPFVEKITSQLQGAGFRVWMDCEGKASLDSKIEAIENATVVLLCISDSYKTSPVCRTEAEYARLLQRDTMPLVVENRYQADGWLSVMIGSKTTLDMSNNILLIDNMPKLLNGLKDKIKLFVLPQTEPPIASAKNWTTSSTRQNKTKSMTRSKTFEPTKSVANWSRDDVQVWLEKMGLKDLSLFFSRFDGATLVALQKMFASAPAIYYCSMKQDFLMTDVLVLLKFTNALEMLG